nr:aminoacyl-tRNA synthetase, class 1a, anticodon-binding [Tanacetum cinerariifolium]
MPLLPAMLLLAQAGEGVEVAAQAVPQHMLAPNQPQDHLSTPPREQTSDHHAQVLKHAQNEPLGGSFNMSPPRSTRAPLIGQPSGRIEDPITLTVLSFVVSTLVQEVKAVEVELKTKKRKMVVSDSDQEEGGKQDVDLDALQTGLKDHKKLFKDVVGKLVKKVKAVEVKLKTKKRKMVVSDSDQEEGGKQDVDLDALRALANAVVTFDSNIFLVERQNQPMTQAQQRTYMRQYVKNQSNDVYTTGWTMAYVKSFTDDQLKDEFEKIQKVQSNSQIQAFSRTLKRTGPMLEEPSSKRKKSIEAPIPSVHEVPQSPVISSPPSLALGRNSNDEAPPVWSTLIGWKVIPTPLGDINALYIIDQSTKHFTTLRQILYLVDRQDLVKLYGLVVQYCKTHPVAGAGLLLWVDLQVLFDSYEGEVLFMFANVSYPLSVKLMEKMLRHKLEIDKDDVGNDMTTTE